MYVSFVLIMLILIIKAWFNLAEEPDIETLTDAIKSYDFGDLKSRVHKGT